MACSHDAQSVDAIGRREFLGRQALGIGSVALAWLMQQTDANAKSKKLPKDAQSFDLKTRQPAVAPKARAMISMFQHGGPSHMDLTDPKPELSKFDGTDYKEDIQYSFVNEASKKLMGTRWKFARHGECGTEFSELLPHTAGIADDICLIRSITRAPMGTKFRFATSTVGFLECLVVRTSHPGFSMAWVQRLRSFRPTWS